MTDNEITVSIEVGSNDFNLAEDGFEIRINGQMQGMVHCNESGPGAVFIQD